MRSLVTPLTRVAAIVGVPAAVSHHNQHTSGVNFVVGITGVLVGNTFREDIVILVHLLGEAVAKGVKGGTHGRLAQTR